MPPAMHASDAAALPALARVTAACNADNLIGNYTSPSGHPTGVTITLMANQKDATQQKWTLMKGHRACGGGAKIKADERCPRRGGS